MPISILLVDDHTILRETLAKRLQSEQGMIVVGGVSNAGDAVLHAERLEPDVVIMDIDMPGKVSFDAARELKVLCPNTAIIYLSAFCQDRYVRDALAAHAIGYVTKDEPVDVLVKAIRQAASGVAYFSPEVQKRIVASDVGLELSDGGTSRLGLLTRREFEVLRYIGRGRSRTEIANVMHISVKTLDNHVHALRTKLQIRFQTITQPLNEIDCPEWYREDEHSIRKFEFIYDF